MIENAAPKTKVGCLWTRAARRVLAPEIERYLARKNVDLLVTDQFEALQVRVRKGIEVLERKIDQGAKLSRSLLIFFGVLGIMGIGIVDRAAAVAWRRQEADAWSVILWINATLVVVCEGFAVLAALCKAHDWLLLRRFRGRYAGAIEKARTSEELLQFSESALADARVLGIVPEETGDVPTSPAGS